MSLYVYCFSMALKKSIHKVQMKWKQFFLNEIHAENLIFNDYVFMHLIQKLLILLSFSFLFSYEVRQQAGDIRN